jgi:DNA-binding CsgD family transcriptional regulator
VNKDAKAINRNALNVSLSHVDKIKPALKPLIDNFNLPYFAYNRILGGEKFLLLSGRETWPRLFYESGGYQGEGLKFFRIPEKKLIHYIWPKKPYITSHHAAYANNIWHGCSIFYKIDHRQIDVFHFASDKNDPKTDDFFISHIDVLESFMSYFKFQYNDLINQIDESDYGVYYKKLNVDLDEQSIQDKQNFFEQIKIRSYILKADGKDIVLTKREAECLYLFSKKHTMKEIAAILKLSPRTVESYINNIRDKAMCSTKAELTEIYEKSPLNQPCLFNL